MTDTPILAPEPALDPPALFDSLHIEALVREWCAGNLYAANFIDGLVSVLRKRLDRSASPPSTVTADVGALVAEKDETERLLLLVQLARLYDATGDDAAWQARATITTLAARVEAAERAFGGLPLPNPLCGMSWEGFNVWGDEKSIKKVRLLEHSASTLPVVCDELRERTITAEARATAAEAALAGRDNQLEAARRQIAELADDLRDAKGGGHDLSEMRKTNARLRAALAAEKETSLTYVRHAEDEMARLEAALAGAVEALSRIAELRYSEAAEPEDDAWEIATAWLKSLPPDWVEQDGAKRDATPCRCDSPVRRTGKHGTGADDRTSPVGSGPTDQDVIGGKAKGGYARAANLSAERRSEIASSAAKVRWLRARAKAASNSGAGDE